MYDVQWLLYTMYIYDIYVSYCLFQHWDVFTKVSEIFILVPSLLGLKGNLEMTLASRLSTQVKVLLLYANNMNRLVVVSY